MNVAFIERLFMKMYLPFKEWKSEWGNIGLVITPILLAIPYINKTLTSNTMYIVLVILFVLICWGHTSYNKPLLQETIKKKNTLERERDILKSTLESIPEVVLKGIYDHLGFDYSDRITIYRYTDDKFYPVGRYAKSLDLRKPGRSEYPKDKGFISLAWAKGGHLAEELPDFEIEPNVYAEKVLSDSKMNKGLVKDLSMKSRSYYCVNLLDVHANPIGVIVFESLNPKLPAQKNEMDRVLESELGKILVKTFETNIPAGREQL